MSACVAARYDYLDICGEPEFMDRIEALYHDKAAERGSLVVQLVGLIRSKIGFLFNSR